MKLKISVLVLLLLPFIIISFFNQPFNDDYWSANAIRSYGRIGQIEYFTENVNARYFANFLMGVFNTLPQGKTWIFKACPIAIIISLFLCFCFFYASVFQTKNRKKIISLALLFVVLHVIAMRSLFEGLYWMFAAISYQVAIMLFVIALSCLIHYYRERKKIYLVITIICSALLPGSVESIAPLFFIFLLMSLFIVYKNNLAVRPIIYCLCINLLAIVFVFTSSGNHVRVSQIKTGYSSDFISAAFYSLRSSGYYSLLWLITPAIILSTLILIPFLKKIIDDTYEKLIIFSNRIYLLLLTILLLSCATVYFAEHYFESSIPYPRITTLYFFGFYHVIILVLSFILLRLRNSKHLNNFCSFLARYKSFIAILFFISVCCSRNFLRVTNDLISGTAYHYNIEANQRFNFLKNSKADTCYIKMHKYWASSIENFSREDLNTNPFIHIDKYFGKTILYQK